MPVWKCSYRLILDPADKEKALLQGWAQAENTSGEDWENVAVSFVAGNPLSFSMDLYSRSTSRGRRCRCPDWRTWR